MNDTKVVALDRHPISASENFGPGIETKYVTHADYRALEERNDFLVSRLDRMAEHNVKLGEELASLRARVVSICAARDRLVEARDRLRKVVARRKFGSRPQLQENANEAEKDFWVVMGTMK